MIEYSRVFLDTAPIIYYLQQDENFFDKTKTILCDMIENDAVFVTSDITTEEYCVYPYKDDRIELISEYERFLQQLQIEVVHTSDTIAKMAAQIRAQHPGFKAMDSLQLSAAVNSGCNLFLTNDKQLLQYVGIKCVTVA